MDNQKIARVVANWWVFTLEQKEIDRVPAECFSTLEALINTRIAEGHNVHKGSKAYQEGLTRFAESLRGSIESALANKKSGNLMLYHASGKVSSMLAHALKQGGRRNGFKLPAYATTEICEDGKVLAVLGKASRPVQIYPLTYVL
jgi:hypothetical protein